MAIPKKKNKVVKISKELDKQLAEKYNLTFLQGKTLGLTPEQLYKMSQEAYETNLTSNSLKTSDLPFKVNH